MNTTFYKGFSVRRIANFFYMATRGGQTFYGTSYKAVRDQIDIYVAIIGR